jgi:hypothetical protein
MGAPFPQHRSAWRGENNLKNIWPDIARRRITVFTGV